MSDLPVAPGTAVRVHYNLHALRSGAPDVWSVSIKVPGKGWRVAGRCHAIQLADARPVVSKTALRIPGWKRRVCAWIEGVAQLPTAELVTAPTVHYNPTCLERGAHFHRWGSELAPGAEWTGGGSALFGEDKMMRAEG